MAGDDCFFFVLPIIPTFVVDGGCVRVYHVFYRYVSSSQLFACQIGSASYTSLLYKQLVGHARGGRRGYRVVDREGLS